MRTIIRTIRTTRFHRITPSKHNAAVMPMMGIVRARQVMRARLTPRASTRATHRPGSAGTSSRAPIAIIGTEPPETDTLIEASKKEHIHDRHISNHRGKRQNG
jgi:hypothetical protein